MEALEAAIFEEDVLEYWDLSGLIALFAIFVLSRLRFQHRKNFMILKNE